MNEVQIYTDVILPLPVRGFFTYGVPQNLLPNIAIGKRVLVQFGTKKIYTALVYAIHNNKPTEFEVKPIFDIIDEIPVVNKYQIRLWEWSADYYMCSIGDFYKAALPNGLRLESETKILPLQIALNDNQFSLAQQQILSILIKNEVLTISEITKLTGQKNPIQLINDLHKKNAIIVQEELKANYKPKLAKYISLHADIDSHEKIEESLISLKSAAKQQNLFREFIALQGIDAVLVGKSILKQTLLEKTEISASVLKGLIAKSVLIESDVEISRLSNKVTNLGIKKELNPNQLQVFEKINEFFEKTDAVLLHGVTSSGKTEIYIHLIEKILEQKMQALYLLPEIALTSQIIQRLKRVFGNKVGVYHSKFSDAERVEIWNNVLQNNENSYQIILGVRSSIFLPFQNLGLIIVDEEHENTYKQYDPSPRYNARDLSIVLASLHKAKVLLGTATPSLESYYNAKTGRYALVELFQRHQDIKLPNIILADVRKAYKKKQMQSHFTPTLIQNIDETLKNNEQVILFQNRRGFSPYLECVACGWVPECKWCDVSLTYHKAINKLVCHYCGYSINAVVQCDDCKQPTIKTKGFGTEKVEDEIAIMFPKARVGRLDLDSTRTKHGHENIINDFQNQRIDILIGTQMVSKGLDFDHVSMVGILSADAMLRFPDFRAYERSFQLMAQVSGRAGRKHKQGKVIIQTYDTDNVIINQVVRNDYNQMYEHQLNERRQFFYPPFSRLIEITVKHRDKDKLNKVCIGLVDELRKISKCKILGPTTPVISRIQNMFIKTILIKVAKGPQITEVKRNIHETISTINNLPDYKTTQIVVDVDPM